MLAANSDDTVQISDVEKLITNGVDVLVIVPHDGTAMAKAVQLAHEAGIPVIAYDRIIRDSDLDLYVSFDNERVGELQARFLVDHLPTPGKGRIVRIYGAKTDNNAAQFKRGQDKVLEPYIERGDIVVLHEDWAEDWKPENAKRIVNAAITANGAGHRRRAGQQRRHRRRRDPGAERGGPRRQGAGHRAGRRDRRPAAHRRGHPGHDDLQAAARR